MSKIIEARLQPIVWLAEQNGSQLDIDTLNAQELAAKRISGKYGVLPSIGCEIEVKRSALQPEFIAGFLGEQDELGFHERSYSSLSGAEKQQFSAICTEYDNQNLPRYEATRAAGIPKGKDAFWEFANAPAYSWRTLAAEVNLLFDAGLVPAGYRHSLHVTLGGAEPGNGGMAMILSGLELLYVSPERIRSATVPGRYGVRNTWARRGDDGMKERFPSELSLGHTTGTEFRSLEVSSDEHASQIFHTSQILTGVLLAYRKRKESIPGAVAELASLWPVYRAAIKTLWSVRGLPQESWGEPHRNPVSWLGWAACLELRDNQSEPESIAVDQVKSVTNRANGILSLLDPFPYPSPAKNCPFRPELPAI